MTGCGARRFPGGAVRYHGGLPDFIERLNAQE